MHALHSDTVVRWHRQGFRFYWRWKSRGLKPGRPAIDAGLRKLIREMQATNMGWGASGCGPPESTVNYSSWVLTYHKRQFQKICGIRINHLHKLGVLFSVIIQRTWQRWISSLFRQPDFECFMYSSCSAMIAGKLYYNVTEHPTAQWTAQQLVEAFPFDSAPRYLLRDRDAIYGGAVRRRIKSLGIEEVITAPRSPWQNPFAERIIGSIRRDCLDHVIVFNEQHLRGTLREYFKYYHTCRTHLSLNKDPPETRTVEPRELGNVVAFPRVGGLHHRYGRIAA